MNQENINSNPLCSLHWSSAYCVSCACMCGLKRKTRAALFLTRCHWLSSVQQMQYLNNDWMSITMTTAEALKLQSIWVNPLDLHICILMRSISPLDWRSCVEPQTVQLWHGCTPWNPDAVSAEWAQRRANLRTHQHVKKASAWSRHVRFTHSTIK